MQDYDMVFLHPPVSFRKLDHPLGGIFEAGTGTTDMLAMMPLGMSSMANEIHRAGLRTAVLNVARLFLGYRSKGTMTLSEDLHAYPACVYGIDLHWSAHTSGALELARWLKETRPGASVILGGLTATFFARHILENYTFIDGVVMGECDGHMTKILRAIQAGTPEEAPGMAYRLDGEVVINDRLHPVLDAVDYMDEAGLVRPRAKLERLERETLIQSIPVVRGCSQDCLFCGGSRRSYHRHFGRSTVELLSVERVLDHARRTASMGITGIKLFGDVRLGGPEYVETLAEGLRPYSRELDLLVELFWPASREHLELLRGSCRDLHISLSPESSHHDLRMQHNKDFDNESLLEQVRICRDLDITPWIWLAYLLPGHDGENLRKELDFIREALALDPSLTTVAHPYLFIDPASEIFDEPDEHGFEVTFRTLEDIRRGMDRPYWFFSIGYRTDSFDERRFHEAILEMTMEQARIYFDSGRLSARDLLKTLDKMECNREVMEIIDDDPEISDEALSHAIHQIFPEHLRRSNSSLLVWPFFGESTGGDTSPEAMLHDAFPTTLEIALRRQPGSARRVHDLIVEFRSGVREELGALQSSVFLPDALRNLMRDVLSSCRLRGNFVDDLLRFEWAIYRFMCMDPGTVDGRRYGDRWVVHTRYDLTDILEVISHLQDGAMEPPPRETWYVMGIRDGHVHALSFDPSMENKEYPDATIRRMSLLGRRLVRSERTVTRVLSRVMGVQEPHLPVTVAHRRTVTSREVDDL